MSDLISRADAIDFVTKLIWNDGEIWNDVQDKIVDGINALPLAEAEWIPCSERLPRTGDDILVTFSDGEVDIIISARPKAWVKYEEANNLIFPVAWMPLPKPYKGGDDK